MNNIFVYCEITEEGTIADVSLELCSKARKLADTLQTKLEAIVIGSNLQNLEAQLYPYGVDIINGRPHYTVEANFRGGYYFVTVMPLKR